MCKSLVRRQPDTADGVSRISLTHYSMKATHRGDRGQTEDSEPERRNPSTAGRISLRILGCRSQVFLHAETRGWGRDIRKDMSVVVVAKVVLVIDFEEAVELETVHGDVLSDTAGGLAHLVAVLESAGLLLSGGVERLGEAATTEMRCCEDHELVLYDAGGQTHASLLKGSAILLLQYLYRFQDREDPGGHIQVAQGFTLPPKIGLDECAHNLARARIAGDQGQLVIGAHPGRLVE
mmetsp:Transcript_12430/g.35089  ORF Transcript_12430/g.35089 Transcript_12430/m.35089 type:complete len:236 (-) Transcript_12430:1171-1878(-)